MNNTGHIYSYNLDYIASYEIIISQFKVKVILIIVADLNTGYLHEKLINENKSLFGMFLYPKIGTMIAGEGNELYRKIIFEEPTSSLMHSEGVGDDIVSEISHVLRRQWHKND